MVISSNRAAARETSLVLVAGEGRFDLGGHSLSQLLSSLRTILSRNAASNQPPTPQAMPKNSRVSAVGPRSKPP
jgi:hypothetical protein